jgi:hypothetical protein
LGAVSKISKMINTKLNQFGKKSKPIPHFFYESTDFFNKGLGFFNELSDIANRGIKV